MGSLEARIEALERLYRSTPATYEQHYRETEERREAVLARLRRIIEEEERKGTPRLSEEEIVQGVQELRRALRERAGYES